MIQKYKFIFLKELYVVRGIKLRVNDQHMKVGTKVQMTQT